MKEFTKTIVNGLMAYIKKARSNWNQNDETAIDYVRNRTHWSEIGLVEILPETTVSTDEYVKFTNSIILEVGKTYNVVFNGTEYECVAWSNGDAVLIGNGSIYGGNDVSTGNIGGNGEPFSCDNYDDGAIYLNVSEYGAYTIKISSQSEIIHKLDMKYLPEMQNKNILNGSAEGSIRTVGANTKIGKWAFAEGNNTKASGYASHAEGIETYAEGESAHAEGDSTIASGENSHAEGYSSEASNYCSHAEGDATEASGSTAHAEGSYTIASGPFSHAEGYKTTASGYNSHAENDYTTASGYDSHAEGEQTIASGRASHAEGRNTTASGEFSHAEGWYTTASGTKSHAEGDEAIASGYASHAEGANTKASGEYQHVQGKYNIEDTEDKYAHIVGNGEYSDDGSLNFNAHTLDWNGNAWFAGDVYIGGTSQDNSDKLATEKKVETSITSPKDYFALTDIDNGYTYIVQMKNGNLVSRCGVSSIEVTTMPDKIEYYAGEYFDDPTGMIVTATCEDGSVIEITNYTYSDNRFAIGGNAVTISYNEAGNTYTTTITVNAIEFDAATILIDFNYTDNGDGTYTITGWKGTKNGVTSTEMVVPNSSNIIL